MQKSVYVFFIFVHVALHAGKKSAESSSWLAVDELLGIMMRIGDRAHTVDSGSHLAVVLHAQYSHFLVSIGAFLENKKEQHAGILTLKNRFATLLITSMHDTVQTERYAYDFMVCAHALLASHTLQPSFSNIQILLQEVIAIADATERIYLHRCMQRVGALFFNEMRNFLQHCTQNNDKTVSFADRMRFISDKKKFEKMVFECNFL